MEIKEIIVVEGKSDTQRLKQVFKMIDTIETRGSAIDEMTLDVIREAQRLRGVIIFTDPDYQGNRIRTIINQAVPGCKNAYIDKNKAISIEKKKVGVEHCKDEDLREALTQLTLIESSECDIKYTDLFNLKLIGFDNSQDLRNKISQKLHIGINNGKQFYNKLKMFHINLIKLESILKSIENEGDIDG